MDDTRAVHVPVLLQEVCAYIQIKPEGSYIDCTLGDGGYSEAILKVLTTGSLLSIDVDDLAIDFVKRTILPKYPDKQWSIKKHNFADLSQEVSSQRIDGILFDLGLSSRQLDADIYTRGFSFRSNQYLDMRMDRSLTVTAEDVLKASTQRDLAQIFRLYGEERYADRIARAIKEYVREKPNETVTTETVVALIRKVVPAVYREGSKHPARRVFQALRIAVNDELHNIQQGIASALAVVSLGGRIGVVSYHSLEDRIVKHAFKKAADSGEYRLITKKPVTPSEQEIQKNARARSAKLRAIEKIT